MTGEYREDTRVSDGRRSEDDRRHDEDRRGQEQRRGADHSVTDDQRSASDRRDPIDRRDEADRRNETERRRLVHGVTYTTQQTLEQVEAWLQENIEGAWNMALCDFTGDSVAKTIVRVMFERPEDKALFEAAKM